MTTFIKYYWIVFGILCFVGGIIGYNKADSMASLIAGSICGAALFWAGWKSLISPKAAAIVALVISLLLLGRFVPLYLKTQKPMPAIPVIVLSITSVVLAAARFKKQ